MAEPNWIAGCKNAQRDIDTLLNNLKSEVERYILQAQEKGATQDNYWALADIRRSLIYMLECLTNENDRKETKSDD